MRRRHSTGQTIFRIIAYTGCILLTILSLFPFVIMIINATRSTPEIQAHTISLLPSTHFLDNVKILEGKSFDPIIGFKNSFIISASATLLTLYFSALTAHALVSYNWKLRKPFFTFIMAVMMIPAQITGIGFFQFMYSIHLTNNFLPLIIPAMAAPAGVFFMRQFMLASMPLELLEAARIDGSHEFYTFNRIVLPIMKPALATQGIFAFVTSLERAVHAHGVADLIEKLYYAADGPAAARQYLSNGIRRYLPGADDDGDTAVCHLLRAFQVHHRGRSPWRRQRLKPLPVPETLAAPPPNIGEGAFKRMHSFAGVRRLPALDKAKRRNI